jgi:hypothetical protein
MRVATGLTVAGTIGAAVAPVFPWARTGRTQRSGFALAHLAQRLGLAHTWPLKALLFAVALLPLFAAMAWTAAALEWRRVMATAAVCAGGVAIAGAVIVWRSSVDALVGPGVGAGAGAAAVAGAIWTAIQTRARTATGETT